MNLWDKKLSFGAVILALMLFSSCEETGDFGLDDDTVSPVDFFTEDIDVTSSVLLIDSIPSSDGETLLVGSVSNNHFGTTVAKSFAKVNLNRENLFDLLDDAVLDSAKINFKFNYRHSEEFEILDLKIATVFRNSIHDSLTYFTKSEAPGILQSRELGGELVIGRNRFEIINLDSTYTMDLDGDWAQDLFQRLKNNDPSVADQESFESEFLGGLALIADEFSTGAFGIEMVTTADGQQTVVSNIVLYYHQTSPTGDGDINLEQVLTFNDAKHFFVLETDRTGSETDVVTDFGTAYEPASGLRYIQEGNAIVTKIDISDFRNFSANRPDAIINFAELTIGPIEPLALENESPPSEILIYLTDDRNTLIPDGNVFRGVQQDGANQIASSATLTMEYDAETRSYSGSITSFLQSHHAEIFQRDQFILFTANMNTSLNGMAFSPDNIALKVFYSELK